MVEYGGPTVHEVGEEETIRAIRAAAPSPLNGDDAAVFDTTATNSRHVCCTDILVDNRHFSRNYSTAFEVGIKAVSQNFADIQAMGARPTAVLLAIATPPDTKLSWVAELSEGINEGTSPWAAELVGGDVVLSNDLVISVTALGELAGPAPALRIDGAGVGQRVIAHGRIGHSAAGLAILQHFGSRDAIPQQDAILQELASWHCAPRLVTGQGTVTRATGASSLTDNSDGLIADLSHIARRSGVHIDINSETIAPDDKLRYAAEVVGTDPWEWVLTGGEDHALIGTTDARVPNGFHTIGSVRSLPSRQRDGAASEVQVVTVDGEKPRYAEGWASL